MNYILKVFICYFIAVSANIAFADIRGLPQINILASSSMAESITKLAKIYSQKNNVTINASFDSVLEQERKIEDGVSADIFISSHPRIITMMKQKGLIDVYSVTNLVKNRLVLAIAKKNLIINQIDKSNNILKQLSFLHNRLFLVVAHPSDSALGIYSKQAIMNIGNEINQSFATKLYNNTIKTGSAKNTIYLIAKGNNAGIAFYSDAINNKDVEIISIIDSKYSNPIIFQAAVVAGENMQKGRDFLIFLKSEQAVKIFQQHGFTTDF